MTLSLLFLFASNELNKQNKTKFLWQDWHCCNRLVKCFDALFDQLTARASITKTSFSLPQLILWVPVAGTAMLLSLQLYARSRWAFAWQHIVMAAFWGKLVERRLIHASTQTWYQEHSMLLMELKKYSHPSILSSRDQVLWIRRGNFDFRLHSLNCVTGLYLMGDCLLVFLQRSRCQHSSQPP